MENVPPQDDPSMFRSDGSRKSARGFLGPIKNNVSGGTMTEVSIGVPIGGKETSIPLMVPGMPQEEIDAIANMGIEGNASNFPRASILRAVEHAMRRMAEGKNVFYQDGEENP